MTYLLVITLLLALLGGWVAIRAAAQRFADRHPEFDRGREEGSGCGGCGNHCGGHCEDGF